MKKIIALVLGVVLTVGGGFTVYNNIQYQNNLERRIESLETKNKISEVTDNNDCKDKKINEKSDNNISSDSNNTKETIKENNSKQEKSTKSNNNVSRRTSNNNSTKNKKPSKCSRCGRTKNDVDGPFTLKYYKGYGYICDICALHLAYEEEDRQTRQHPKCIECGTTKNLIEFHSGHETCYICQSCKELYGDMYGFEEEVDDYQ